MKYGKLAAMLGALLFALTAQAVTVDGYVYLSGQTDHTGTHNVAFDASGLPSGVYVYRLSANGWSDAKKMVVLR